MGEVDDNVCHLTQLCQLIQIVNIKGCFALIACGFCSLADQTAHAATAANQNKLHTSPASSMVFLSVA